MSEWISVQDRLPEKPGFYLVYEPRDHYMMETCFYSSYSGWQYRYRDTGREAGLITHWMVLPEPAVVDEVAKDE